MQITPQLQNQATLCFFGIKLQFRKRLYTRSKRATSRKIITRAQPKRQKKIVRRQIFSLSSDAAANPSITISNALLGIRFSLIFCIGTRSENMTLDSCSVISNFQARQP
jgi:hypothetical protein